MNNLSLNEKYLVDKEGRRVGVVLSMQEFQSLINRLEELESFKSAPRESAKQSRKTYPPSNAGKDRAEWSWSEKPYLRRQAMPPSPLSSPSGRERRTRSMGDFPEAFSKARKPSPF